MWMWKRWIFIERGRINNGFLWTKGDRCIAASTAFYNPSVRTCHIPHWRWCVFIGGAWIILPSAAFIIVIGRLESGRLMFLRRQRATACLIRTLFFSYHSQIISRATAATCNRCGPCQDASPFPSAPPPWRPSPGHSVSSPAPFRAPICSTRTALKGKMAPSQRRAKQQPALLEFLLNFPSMTTPGWRPTKPSSSPFSFSYVQLSSPWHRLLTAATQSYCSDAQTSCTTAVGSDLIRMHWMCISSAIIDFAFLKWILNFVVYKICHISPSAFGRRAQNKPIHTCPRVRAHWCNEAGKDPVPVQLSSDSHLLVCVDSCIDWSAPCMDMFRHGCRDIDVSHEANGGKSDSCLFLMDKTHS